MPDLRERLYDALLHVDRVVHLDTITGEGDDEDKLDWMIASCDRLLEGLYGWDDVGTWEIDELEEAILGHAVTGWLLEVSTPERGRWPTYSWGAMYSAVFHGATYDEALEKAFAWVAALGQDRYGPSGDGPG